VTCNMIKVEQEEDGRAWDIAVLTERASLRR
jgi:hypothetical protein